MGDFAIPCNPQQSDLLARLFHFTKDINATCSSCTIQDVELYPLVRSGIIPKHLAQVMSLYTSPLAYQSPEAKLSQRFDF